jgi:hypothetical protein
MRKWILLSAVMTILFAVAPASQASPLMPAGPLAGVAAQSGDTVLVRHKRWHWKKKFKRRHYGWVRGKHKGWSHSRHRYH